MSLPTIFDICVPREDVKKGGVAESDFAADLAQVLRGDAPDEYKKPVRFFANTHPTRGLRDLLRSVCLRLSGSGEQVASIFRLDTQYGGGKTHSLIALAHAAGGMKGVPNVAEFIDPKLLPKGEVRIAAFDGENADPANGRLMGEDVRAFTPWGELAYGLAGKKGYESIAKSDVNCVAPGAENIRALFGNKPTLILIDELSIYLRKLKQFSRDQGAGQLTAFLTALFKAVEGTPNAALVYTLALGKDGKASDAYGEENQFIADHMAEAESVSARKATLLNPTEEDETVQVLRRRLFESVDEAKAAQVVAAYKSAWEANVDALPPTVRRPETLASFKAGYPLHPELMATLTGKTATLGNFQRVRGMLRLLARTVALLWERKPSDTYAVHVHHVDPGFEPLKGELVTRLGLKQYVPAITNDVSAAAGHKPALAQELDGQVYGGLAPYGSFVARTTLLHTFAFNDALKGVNPEELRFAILAPGLDLGFVEDARKRFIAASSYLDDRPGAPLRFLAEANLTQVIRREQENIDKGEVRSQLNDRIKEIFKTSVLELVPFASGPYDVPDDAGPNGRPYLVLLGYDAVDVGAEVEGVPPLVESIYTTKGSAGDPRINRNNIVFLVADASRKEEMKKQVARRLALFELKKPERLADLAAHQQDRVKELYEKSNSFEATAVQQCYRHVFYPSRNRLPGAAVDLAHTGIDVGSTSDTPGKGQLQVARVLQESSKLRMEDDSPDSPVFIRDRTPLKKGQITTLALRNEFRRDPSLPVLIGDGIFVKAIRLGIEQGEYIYRMGDLVHGKGDPFAEIKIDEQAVIFTMQYAKEHGIWPRPAPKVEPIGGGQVPTYGGGGGGPMPKPPLSGELPHVGPGVFRSEGPLKQALTELWEKARTAKVEQVGRLHVQLFDGGDVFKLLGAIGSVAGAEKRVTLEGGYVTSAGGEMQVEFTGNVDDAAPVKEFLDPQLRAAKERTLQATFDLAFADGLALKGDAAEKLTDKLSKFAAGAAAVAATAEAKK